MRAKRKEGCAARAMIALLGLLCALALGAMFYATMVYQLGGEGAPAREDGAGGGTALLSLADGALLREETGEQTYGGQTCRVVTREYVLVNGASVLAVSASPAAYVERLSQEGWQPQLVTGFMLAGLDAVYELRGERAMLLARDGDTVYLIEGSVSEQELYALGVGATLESL